MLFPNSHENLVALFLCLNYSAMLFLIGIVGLIINRRNLLLMLLSLELTFLSSALNYLFVSSLINLLVGSIYAVLIIIMVVADTTIGLSLVVLAYRGSKIATVGSFITLRN